MKRLIIVRHGKAEQGNYDNDFSRSLTSRGEDDANKISEYLKSQGYSFYHVISSPAKRAISTALIFAGNLGYPEQEIEENSDLYFSFTTSEFVDYVERFNPVFETVAIFGHNPFMAFVSGNMSKRFSGDMPTCSTVVIEFDVDEWHKVEAREGEVKMHLMPRMFR